MSFVIAAVTCGLDLERGFTVPLVPVVPVLSIVACAWLMLNLTGLTWIRFGIWMVVGFVIYFAYGRRHSVLARRPAVAARGVYKTVVICLDSRQMPL